MPRKDHFQTLYNVWIEDRNLRICKAGSVSVKERTGSVLASVEVILLQKLQKTDVGGDAHKIIHPQGSIRKYIPYRVFMPLGA